jgi:hypothetical protein
MSNIDALRETLFDTIQKLKDGNLDTEKAKTIGDLSQVIINSAKVEVDFIRANGGGQSRFISTADVKQITQTPTGSKSVEGNMTVHRLRG